MTAGRFKAIAWDIDGTLVDSEPLHHGALVAASLEFGTDLADLPDMAFRGVHMGDVWKLLRSHLPASLEEDLWLEAINRHYVAGRHNLRPIPGAIEAVRKLDELRIPQVCVSNSCRTIVDANLDALGLTSYIRFSISIDDVSEGKPSAIPYRNAVDRLGLFPGTVISVEDSLTGLRSSKGAGLYSIFLRSEERQSIAQDANTVPDMVISSPSHLMPLFQA